MGREGSETISTVRVRLVKYSRNGRTTMLRPRGRRHRDGRDRGGRRGARRRLRHADSTERAYRVSFERPSVLYGDTQLVIPLRLNRSRLAPSTGPMYPGGDDMVVSGDIPDRVYDNSGVATDGDGFSTSVRPDVSAD